MVEGRMDHYILEGVPSQTMADYPRLRSPRMEIEISGADLRVARPAFELSSNPEKIAEVLITLYPGETP